MRLLRNILYHLSTCDEGAHTSLPIDDLQTRRNWVKFRCSKISSDSSLMVVHLHSRPGYHSAVDIVVEPGIATGTAHMSAGPDALELQHTSCRIQEVVEGVPSRNHPGQAEVVASLAVAVDIGRNHYDSLAIVADYVLGMSYVTGCHSSGFLLVPLRVLPLYRGIRHVVPGHLGCDRILLHGPSFAGCHPR